MRIDRHKQKILAFVAALVAVPAAGNAAGRPTNRGRAGARTGTA